MVNEGLTAMAGQSRILVAAFAGLAALGASATGAQAQWFPSYGYGGPVVYYQPRPIYPPANVYVQPGAGLHPVEVASLLSRRHGFSQISRPVRQGPVFVATAIDGGGQRLRVIVDAYTGALLDGQLLGPPPRVARNPQTRTRVAVARPEAPARVRAPARDAAPRQPPVAAVKPIAPKPASPLAPAPAQASPASSQPAPAATASYPPALAPALAPVVAPALVKPAAPAAQTAPSTVKAETRAASPAAAPGTNAQGQPVRMIPIAPLEETRRAPTGPQAPAVPPAGLN